MKNLPMMLLGFGAVSATTAFVVDPPVNLQAATPGVAQTGHVNVTGTVLAGNVSATTASATGKAVSGSATSTSGANFGGYFQSASTSGRGIYGISTAVSGSTIGGLFSCASVAGRGVWGSSSATTGVTYGGYFQAASTTGRGVFGISSATTGTSYGGYFQAASTTGKAVYGYAPATTGLTNGGRFDVASVNGRGVVGAALATTGDATGGLFQSLSVSGFGAYGWASQTTGLNYGLFGRSDSTTNGYGVFAQGRTGATGTKSFRIDHPLDPEGKFLFHYSSESPTPQNFYGGNVRTNAQGKAWVELPEYFAEINTDFKYQLTVVEDSESTSFVQAKVARKIRENKFLIMTSAPNMEVSWRVEATRNDAWVRRYGAPTSVEKTREVQGLYQDPELYGKDSSHGMFNLDTEKAGAEGIPPKR